MGKGECFIERTEFDVSFFKYFFLQFAQRVGKNSWKKFVLFPSEVPTGYHACYVPETGVPFREMLELLSPAQFSCEQSPFHSNMWPWPWSSMIGPVVSIRPNGNMYMLTSLSLSMLSFQIPWPYALESTCSHMCVPLCPFSFFFYISRPFLFSMYTTIPSAYYPVPDFLSFFAHLLPTVCLQPLLFLSSFFLHYKHTQASNK